VLHEAWLKLHNKGMTVLPANPPAYLIRLAFNIAQDRLRLDNRLLNALEISSVLLAGAAEEEAKSEAETAAEIERLTQALNALPERQRLILELTQVEKLTHNAVAERLNITRRTVHNQLRAAIAFCLEKLRE
jgi:RNA polymerase sigma-70 factor (ECF subfamily)